MASPIRLSLLPYLQSWDSGRLRLRLLAVPRGSPLDPLVPGLTPPGPSFAEAALAFDVRLVQGLSAMATTTAPSQSVVLTPGAPPRAKALFEEISRQLPIDPAPPPVDPRPAGTRIKKFLPATYREASGFSASRTPFAVTDDSYLCAIQSGPPKPFRTRPNIPAKIPWAKALALALRQRLLAEALGLVRPLEVVPPSAEFFEEGGWVYVTLAAAGDAFALTTTPDALKLYATRVPPLTVPRPLFTPVLFPVAALPPPGPYDELFQEAADYDDGFAKVVHATQPRFLDALSEKDDGSRPVKEVGIRLGWDDEQVTVWFNRQIDPAAAPLDAPMGVFGYRVDAREAGTSDWASLCRAQGPVKVGPAAVDSFDDELGVEVVPTQLEGQKLGTYWLPMYYTHWTGPSLVALDTLAQHLAGGPDLSADPDRVRGVAPPVPLRYGKTFELRVRLMDHTGAGPDVGKKAIHPALHPIFRLPFRRWIRPRSVQLLDELPPVPDAADAPDRIKVRRPLLAYPEYILTGATNAASRLLADLSAAKAEGREVGLPDPDVDRIHVTVQVEALGLDAGAAGGYQTLYETTRPFPAPAGATLTLRIDWQDVKDASTLAPAPTSGALLLPTARNVRLVLRPLCADDPGHEYFGAEDVRLGPPVSVNLRSHSSDERGLFRPETPARRIKGVFLQPDTPVDAAVALSQKAAGKGQAAPGNAIGRLADALELVANGLTLRARPGRRVVFGCSPTLRHVLAPDASSVSLASNNDLVQIWIVAVRATLDRDWSWDGLAPAGVAVVREGSGVIGRLEPRRTVSEDALLDAERDQTDLIYLDAIDPKPEAGRFPAELEVDYRLEPEFVSAPTRKDAPLEASLRLPITTPPTQVPRLVAAGIALSPYQRSPDYSRTEPRRRVLWLEFERPVDNPNDACFARLLRYAPDPLLLRDAGVPEAAEPPLPVDPEPIRIVVPGQSDDRSGLGAMQPLGSSDSGRHFTVPLPPGLYEDSPELFGMFTYELRIGHERGWSTAQGRFGTALRVAGVQHPCPMLTCFLVRDSRGIQASAAFANPVYEGRSLRGFPPATEIWVALYAQVIQADGADTRNVLLSHRPARSQRPPLHDRQVWDAAYALATWSNDEVRLMLEALTLEPHTPLSALAVETLPGDAPLPDPLGADLGHQRILRTSPLVPVPEIC